MRTKGSALQVLTALIAVCLLAPPLAGDASAEERKEPSRAPDGFLLPPGPMAAPSMTQRVARWFFSPDGPPERMPEIQDRKPAPSYGPPKPPSHGQPPRLPSQFGPPRLLSIVESPPSPPSHRGTSGRYGPPKPSDHHVRPPKSSNHGLPSSQYGPPKLPTHHGPPSTHSRSPNLLNNHGPSSSKHGQPTLSSLHAPPSKQYGPPKPPSHRLPAGAYGPPQPALSHGPPVSIHYGPPPPPLIIPPQHRPGVPQHPASGGHVKGRSCNPCNKVPWVPISTGHSTSSAGAFLPSGPSAGDVPPSPQQSIEGSGLLNAPGNQYGPPPSQYPSNQYGPPPPKIPSDHYGPPPPQPPSGQYGPPPPQTPSKQYALPQSPDNHYLPPIYKTPSNQYGPPPVKIPSDQYDSPPSQPTNDQYGPPPPQTPSDQFGTPPPQSPIDQYGPPPHKTTGDLYGPPPPQLHVGPYGSPETLPSSPPHSHLAPGDQYGPPSITPLIQTPKDKYGAPGGSVPNTLYGSAREPVLSPSYLAAPPVHDAQIFNKHPSSVPEYLIPPNSADSSTGYGQLVPFSNGDNIDVIKSVAVLSDSLPAAQHSVTESLQSEVAQDDLKSIHLVPESHKWNLDQEGTALNDQLDSPSGGNLNVPLLSHDGSNQIPAREPQHPSTQSGSGTGLAVIKSVKVADFVSSIEYPLEVVQSPYIDVDTQTFPSKEDNLIRSQSSESQYSSQSQDEIIVGRPIINEEFDIRDKYNNHQSNTGNNENTRFDPSDNKQELQHHLESSSSSLSPQEGASNISISSVHGTDQKPSSTNKEIVNEKDTPPTRDDLNPAGNNLYSGGNLQESAVRHEEHIGLPHNIGNVTHTQGHGNGVNDYNVQGQSQSTIITGSGDGQKGAQNSVIVDIQPSIQTSAQGASLIYQINGLNTPPPPFQHSFPNTPAQTSVFVTFQHAPQKPFNFPPLNQHLPPPAPFQNTFQQGPPPPYSNTYPAEPPVTYLNPPREPFRGFSTVTNPPAVDYPSWAPTVDSFSSTSTWGSVTTSAPQTPFRHHDSNGVSFSNAGLLPPPPPHSPMQGHHQNKKTKQIQIIVPYTSSRDHIQFRFPNENHGGLDTSGWSPLTNEDPIKNEGRNVPTPLNCSDIISDGSKEFKAAWQEHFIRCNGQTDNVNTPQRVEIQDDYHQHQESRRVTAMTPVKEQQSGFSDNGRLYRTKPQSGFSEVQHILASNIRDLLRGEEEAKPPSDSVNLLNLQKNIDKWTALEFSMSKNNQLDYQSKEDSRSTTAKTSLGPTLQHLLLPSKKIPEEYLTTTPLTFDDYTENHNLVSTPMPSIKQRFVASKAFGNGFYDHDASGSHTHAVTANKSRGDDRYRHSWKFFESNLVVPEAVTTTSTTTTTPAPTNTEQLPEETTEATVPTVAASWDHLEMSISPITKEKVYVVTPLSTWLSPSTTPSPPEGYHPFSRATMYVTTTSSPAPTSINDIIPFRNSFHSPAEVNGVTPLAFHSPRFLIRPTPLPSLHRLFTVRSTLRDAAGSTEDDSNRQDSYPPSAVGEDEYYITTPGPVNSTVSKSRGSPALFGLNDLPTYTPPDGARVQTYSGHSKVVTVVTPPTLVSGKKRFTSSSTSTTTTPQPLEVVSEVRRLRPDRDSYLWNFPELLAPGDMLREEDVAAVRGAVVELKKERRS